MLVIVSSGNLLFGDIWTFFWKTSVKRKIAFFYLFKKIFTSSVNKASPIENPFIKIDIKIQTKFIMKQSNKSAIDIQDILIIQYLHLFHKKIHQHNLKTNNHLLSKSIQNSLKANFSSVWGLDKFDRIHQKILNPC